MPINRAQQMAEFFSALSDPNRLRLMSALAHINLYKKVSEHWREVTIGQSFQDAGGKLSLYR
ncbi:MULTISPECIES: transcriptional regulator [unclassified Tolypothrix]|uniref:transcriptional regulator n=1 Tax=unclassified Tolypothrix TaxID=2649714 RepID=UPI000693AD51|nr:MULTISPECIES: transcriptional regulator [unclassified Tolypothrix]BAY89680.1 zinc-responsive repressor ZiaR [Microchaete diplosiphon NIES-3275]